MSTKEKVLEIQKTFDVNAIYARLVYDLADKTNLLEDVARIITEKPKPFVKWVGGKRQLLKQFYNMGLYPPFGFDPTKNTYFEPFVGGGAVFFDLLPKKAVLSDLNFELVTTYNIIKNDVESLIRSLKKHVYDKEYFLKIRARNVESLSDIQIASRFIYLNRTGFNGMYRVNSSGGFNVPFGKYTNPRICDAENLRKVSQVLQSVEIRHQDYKDVLQKAKSGDYVYFDPPYYPINRTSNFTGYTAEGFFEKEQEELRDTFVELHNRGCFVMLSNSDTPFINKLYSDLDKKIKLHKVNAGRNINSDAKKRGKIKEVLVVNY
jgi:DNA adenine methylase